MSWVRQNAVGLLGLVLAVLTFAVGFYAYRIAVQRDEQTRAIELRLERGEADLAEQHRRGAAALGRLAKVLADVTYSAAVLAAGAAGLGAARNRPNLWLIGATAVFAIGGVGLAVASRA